MASSKNPVCGWSASRLGHWSFLFALLICDGVRGAEPRSVRVERLPQLVFAADLRRIETIFRNSSSNPVTLNLVSRLYQASSSILVPLGESKPSRTLTISPNQAVVEPMDVLLPPVRSETTFVLQWRDAEEKLGATIIRAFPTNLLEQLPKLNGGHPVGLFDPGGSVKSTFSSDLVQPLSNVDEMSSYEGTLLICVATGNERTPGLSVAVKRKAEKGGAVVWIQEPAVREIEGFPAVRVIDAGEGRIVVARGTIVSDLANAPAPQLALIHLAELATGARKLELPKDPDP